MIVLDQMYSDDHKPNFGSTSLLARAFALDLILPLAYKVVLVEVELNTY